MANSTKQLSLLGEEVLPDVIRAPRTDSIYNAHAYLTKIPVDGIIPFLETFTEPGATVVDMFAGSGMTSIACFLTGRTCVASDISVLGKHIHDSYLGSVPASNLRIAAQKIVKQVRTTEGELYQTKRLQDGIDAEMVRTIWTFIYECASCSGEINYYETMQANGWHAPKRCPHCSAQFTKRGSSFLREEPAVVVIDGIDGRQIEQPISKQDLTKIKKALQHPLLKEMPDIEIESNREMYKRSALAKWKLERTKNFFSPRNAVILTAIRKEIDKVEDGTLKRKLLFAFTGVLARASKRYQWSPARPLNAANQNYYIAPVFFEWNVFELFERKIEAAIRADEEISERRNEFSQPKSTRPENTYKICSADKLEHLPDESVDYIFTDPPFGSNIFYSDMNLFHEVWLGKFTDPKSEAVIHTVGKSKQDAITHYYDLLFGACKEAFRVLKSGAHFTIVFGNSSGQIWELCQRALRESGFDCSPVHVATLDKGQRSVKGLNSGSEPVSTLDLIITLKKPDKRKKANAKPEIVASRQEIVSRALKSVSFKTHNTPSHLYMAVLKEAMLSHRTLEDLHLSDILVQVRELGYRVDAKTGKLQIA